MKLFKSQIEYRYTPLLDFPEFIKSVISPYQRIAELNLADIYSEKYVLNFKGDGYLIDVRADRMIYIGFTDLGEINAQNGKLIHFFSLISKIENHMTFGKHINCLYAQWLLEENNESFERNRETFISKHLNKLDWVESSMIKDVGLILEMERNGFETKLHMGPYDKDQDPQKSNLIVLDKVSLDKNGFLINLISVKNSKLELGTLKKMDDIQSKILSQLKI